jgi:hypothetical protein
MQCPACKADNNETARQCSACGARLSRRRRNGPGGGETTAESWIDSPNPTALTAYRCGLWAMIPLAGLVLGPAALVLGLAGRRRERPNPSERGTAQATAAIVLGVLTTLTNWIGLLLILHGLAAVRGAG